jgi:tRNA dimethylallyltransferase
MKEKVIVILGPTAIGKSSLAVKIAKLYNGEVISADSRQVYKYLDIGTGKITQKEMDNIPHHGLDLVSPKKTYSVVLYQKYALKKIKDILKRGKTPIICGGTGFYIDAVTQNFILPTVPANPILRKELNKNTPEENYKILLSLDPERALNIDNKNNVRLIRAIEITKVLGKVPNLAVEPLTECKYEFIKIGLTLPQEDLYKNIETRVKIMFKDGLLNEIEKLAQMKISTDKLREFGFEYYNPTLESVISGSRKYAKRQMTWFKRDKDINWFSPKDFLKIIKCINQKLKS